MAEKSKRDNRGIVPLQIRPRRGPCAADQAPVPAFPAEHAEAAPGAGAAPQPVPSPRTAAGTAALRRRSQRQPRAGAESMPPAYDERHSVSCCL